MFVRFTQDPQRAGCAVATFSDLGDGSYLLRKENRGYRELRIVREDLDQLGVLDELRREWDRV